MSFRNHIASFAECAAATYLLSVVESEIISCRSTLSVLRLIVSHIARPRTESSLAFTGFQSQFGHQRERRRRRGDSDARRI